MFEESGKTIKQVVNVLFWISVALSVVTAIVLGFAGGEFHALLFFLILFGGILVSWIVCLFYSAFGDLVENSLQTKKNSEEIRKNTLAAKKCLEDCTLMRRLIAGVSAEEEAGSHIGAAPRNVGYPRSSYGNTPAGSTRPQTFVVCPYCGNRQRRGQAFCEMCGKDLSTI